MARQLRIKQLTGRYYAMRVLASESTFTTPIDDICPVSGSDTQRIKRVIRTIVPFHPFKNGSQSNPPGHFLPRLDAAGLPVDFATIFVVICAVVGRFTAGAGADGAGADAAERAEMRSAVSRNPCESA